MNCPHCIDALCPACRRDAQDELAQYDRIVAALAVPGRFILQPDTIHQTAVALIQRRREFQKAQSPARGYFGDPPGTCGGLSAT